MTLRLTLFLGFNLQSPTNIYDTFFCTNFTSGAFQNLTKTENYIITGHITKNKNYIKQE